MGSCGLSSSCCAHLEEIFRLISAHDVQTESMISHGRTRCRSSCDPNFPPYDEPKHRRHRLSDVGDKFLSSEERRVLGGWPVVDGSPSLSWGAVCGGHLCDFFCGDCGVL